MWRALFLAIGFYCILLGAEALAVERVVLKPKKDGDRIVSQREDLKPAEWTPWSLMAGGAVVVLYSFTIPRRVKD